MQVKLILFALLALDIASYFERDVECVRRFFRKRFRYHSDEFPRFQDVVPEYARKQTKLPKSAPDAENLDEAEATAREGGDMRLDLLAKASGFGGSKQDRELEQVRLKHRPITTVCFCAKGLGLDISTFHSCVQYMSSLRLSTTEGMIEVADSEDDDSLDDDEEGDGDDDDVDDESGEDEENEDEESDAGVSRKDRKAAKANAAASVKPSRGAARKAALDGDDSKIAQLVASDRAKAARRAEKHHGRKAHAGKGGRAHAGGKAKTGKARMISDSMDF